MDQPGFHHESYEYRPNRRHKSQQFIARPQLEPTLEPMTSQQDFSIFRYDDPIDDVNKHEGYYHQDIRCRALDQVLLSQPYDDRYRQAIQGRARLSLPRSSTRVFHPPVLPKLPYISYDDSFISQRPPLQELSSDVPFGSSSSPALRASQRKAEGALISLTTDIFSPQTPTEAWHEPEQDRFGCDAQEKWTEDSPEHQESDLKRDSVQQQKQLISGKVQNISTVTMQRSAKSRFMTPMIQNIQIVPVTALPDRLRSVFPFPNFNAIQSKCFETVFNTNDNFVLASPTGSGKTAVLELAICRAMMTNTTDQHKIIYQAPLKALCSERQRDWEAKFSNVGLTCAELTGDSDAADLRNVQMANIIITTPEKWDSVTRKWRDHEKLMNMVKLFLIDEVHILKDDRGAVLETVVSRMKTINRNVRFLALSATVPNFHDVAAWLGKSTMEPHIPAAKEKFGEEFRPVKLRKHVIGYPSNISNDFAFEKVLDARLPDVISKFSLRKPMMIFCATRNSTIKTAKLITSYWNLQSPSERLWEAPTKRLTVSNKDLSENLASGVAFHHAGLDLGDRVQVEKGFLEGDIICICCTSTLAVGVNLPCHLVIVKNTVGYGANGPQEYSDLEMMQMLGRAGRPQFDDDAVAVIMTRHTKVRRYESMVTGQDLLESKLHLNLIDHMNAEIGLGTIHDLETARTWLSGTFLYVRLQQNAAHYKLKDSKSGQDISEQVDDICFRDISLLREYNLVTGQDSFQCTEFGHAMARYYVHFDTMKVLTGIQPKSPPSEILSAIAQAAEFSMIRFRQGEKGLYKSLNKSPSIRWSIPVNLDIPAHKVSLIIQSVLGSADITWDGETAKHRGQYLNEVQTVFKSAQSLIRCIIDCQVFLGDSITIHSALLLERSIGARAWDDSPLQMKQLDGIGVVGVRKLVNAGVRCLDDLETCEPYRLEALIGRNPPFGLQILEKIRSFPKLHVSVQAQPSSISKAVDGVKIQVRATIGFLNEKPLQRFAGKPIYVCFLATTSDGRKAHFVRISGQKVGSGQTLLFGVILTNKDQSVNCHIMCEGIAGSMREAVVKPQVPPTMFPIVHQAEPVPPRQSNTSKRRVESVGSSKPFRLTDDFDDGGIEDDDMMEANFGNLNFDHIENYTNPSEKITRKSVNSGGLGKQGFRAKTTFGAGIIADDDQDELHEQVKLPNGKWACNHKCKNKESCKHLCCKEGTDRPPKKKSYVKQVAMDACTEDVSSKIPGQKGKGTQTRLQITPLKRRASAQVDELDLTYHSKRSNAEVFRNETQDVGALHQLQTNSRSKEISSPQYSMFHQKPAHSYSHEGDHELTFMYPTNTNNSQLTDARGNYGDNHDMNMLEDQNNPMPEMADYHAISSNTIHRDIASSFVPFSNDSQNSDPFGDDDSLLADAMIGLADSQQLYEGPGKAHQTLNPWDSSCSDVVMTGPLFSTCAKDIGGGMEISRTFPEANQSSAQTDQVCKTAAQTSQSHSTGDTSLFNIRKFIQHRPNDTSRHSDHLETAQSDHFHSPFLLKSANEAVLQSLEQEKNVARNFPHQSSDGMENNQKCVPTAFSDLEPWLFKEFGDIVELVDE